MSKKHIFSEYKRKAADLKVCFKTLRFLNNILSFAISANIFYFRFLQFLFAKILTFTSILNIDSNVDK